MATNFTLELDTTGPQSPAVVIEGGAAYSGDFAVDIAVTTSDSPTTGYQVKIYGDVDDAADTARYRTAEANAPWISLGAGTFTGIQLTSGDGSKTVKVKIRDDVFNPSSEATDTITVDSTLPVPNITVAPDYTKISKQTGKRTSTFTFQSSEAVQAWKVKAVSGSGAVHSSGTQIPTTNGSTGVSGGSLAASTPQVVAIDGADLETALGADGTTTIKVFVQDANTGIWSV
jgi:hypothetical protein